MAPDRLSSAPPHLAADRLQQRLKHALQGRLQVRTSSRLPRFWATPRTWFKEAPGWSEHDAEIALRAVQQEHAGGNGDEWGDLSKVHEVAYGETIKRLAEEERRAGHEPW